MPQRGNFNPPYPAQIAPQPTHTGNKHIGRGGFSPPLQGISTAPPGRRHGIRAGRN